MSEKTSRPPRLSRWLMERVARSEEIDTIIGDMDEFFVSVCEQQGRVRARVWYWTQVFKSIPVLLFNSVYWRFVMLKNYLKVTLRNIRNHKIYSLINISGLAVGLACCILIFLYVNFELSYDRYHEGAERVYRVSLKISRESTEMETARVSTPLIPAIRESFPELEASARFQTMDWRRNLVQLGDKQFYESQVMVAENDLFYVLTIPFLSGDPETALIRPDTVVISKSKAEKYFGHDNPIGQTLSIWGRPFEVTGVVVDTPENTHIKYGFILSLNGFERVWNMENWGWTGFYAYIKLKPGVDVAAFEDKIRIIANRYIPDQLVEWGATFNYFLQPITSVHLKSNLNMEVEAPGNPTYLYIFSVIGFLILLLSVINFTNLTTARSSNRSREVGIRKVVGARRSQLTRQFLGESLLTSFFATMGAVILSILVLPYFNGLTGNHFEPSSLLKPSLILVLVLLALFVGFAGGSYPAFLLSFLRPVRVLKGNLNIKSGGNLFRKTLVLCQFAVTITLLIGTMVVYRQLNFMKNMYLGFEKEQKLILPVDFHTDPESVKAEFLKHPAISEATACWSVPGRQTNRIEARILEQAEDRAQSMDFLYIDSDFIPAYKIDIVAGRAFQKNKLTDVMDTFVINEAAMKAFGFDSPDMVVGSRMYEGGSGNVGTIIGVAKDFHFKGLQTAVEPLVLQLNPDYFSQLSLTLQTNNLNETLSFVENKWKKLHLGSVFSYFFLDEDFNRQYGAEENVGRLALSFTILAVFISCLGLVGLSSYTAEQRTKEIGIRKVLGASVPHILLLLTREFTQWVLVANIIAWPLGYIFMSGWLRSFAYRTPIGLGIFLVSGAMALGLALLTVSFQSVKAALSNPVHSLRYE